MKVFILINLSHGGFLKEIYYFTRGREHSSGGEASHNESDSEPGHGASSTAGEKDYDRTQEHSYPK